MRSGSGSRTSLEDLQNPVPALAGGEARVLAQHLVDLLADTHDRVERGHRLLEDHRHARRAQLPQAPRSCREHVLALEEGLSRRRLQRLVEKAHHGVRDDGLSRAQLPDEAEDLPRLYGKTHALDRVRAVGTPRQRDHEILNVQNRRDRAMMRQGRLRIR